MNQTQPSQLPLEPIHESCVVIYTHSKVSDLHDVSNVVERFHKDGTIEKSCQTLKAADVKLLQSKDKQDNRE